MLDIRRIRSNPELVKQSLARRGGEYDIDAIVALDEKRREVLVKVEEMKAEQNKVSKEVPKLKKQGEDATEVLKEMKELSVKIGEYDSELREIDAQIKEKTLEVPNIPNADIPEGTSEDDNLEIKKWGTPREFDFEIKPHWDLGTNLDILDFERATKLTGARFTLFKGHGAALERALINFMLTTHTTKNGYTEISPPFMVNRESMIGTGQLPKFADDMFKIEGKEFYMIPTAEVPVTNIHRGEILDESELPIFYVAYTPCFRQEAGSAGRDTRGIIRNHQFDKVELVKLVKPEDSYEELEKLTRNAEGILEALEIPYRVIDLCAGDIGFSSAKTYDIEVWMPSYNRYVEISSCSNFEDFQARRANLKYRSTENGKAEFMHTLNGSGLAVGRTLAALLENYQQKDGSIAVPKALQPFMGGLELVEKK